MPKPSSAGSCRHRHDCSGETARGHSGHQHIITNLTRHNTIIENARYSPPLNRYNRLPQKFCSNPARSRSLPPLFVGRNTIGSGHRNRTFSLQTISASNMVRTQSDQYDLAEIKAPATIVQNNCCCSQKCGTVGSASVGHLFINEAIGIRYHFGAAQRWRISCSISLTLFLPAVVIVANQ